LIRPALILCVSCAALSAHAADRVFVTHPFTILTLTDDFTSSVSAGDFNGDGAIDILESNGRHWPQANRIHFNNGEGRVRLAKIIGDHEATTYQLVPGDFDGDGDLDIVEATDNAGAYLYRNRGDGSFEVEETPAGPTSSRSAVALDADNDGDLDIFLSNRGEPGMLLKNNGKGKFKAVSIETTDSGSVGSAAADFNGDGAADLLLAVRDGDSALALFNDGEGHFAERKTFDLAGTDIRAVTAGDMDGDGNLDIVYGVVGGSSLIVFGDGAGGAKSRAAFAPDDSNAFGLALSDLDRDGDLDIVMARTGQTNLVFFNDGSGTAFETAELDETPWTAPEGGEAWPDSYNLVLADLDGDGFDDIVIANSLAPNPIYMNRPNRD